MTGLAYHPWASPSHVISTTFQAIKEATHAKRAFPRQEGIPHEYHGLLCSKVTVDDEPGHGWSVLGRCVTLMLHRRVPPIVHKCFLASGIHTHAMHSPGVFQRSHDFGLH
jgi:hypothetical protein